MDRSLSAPATAAHRDDDDNNIMILHDPSRSRWRQQPRRRQPSPSSNGGGNGGSGSSRGLTGVLAAAASSWHVPFLPSLFGGGGGGRRQRLPPPPPQLDDRRNDREGCRSRPRSRHHDINHDDDNDGGRRDARDRDAVFEETSGSCHPAMRFRAIAPSDRDQIQALHELWFPVRYQDEFYDDLAGIGSGGNRRNASININNSNGSKPAGTGPPQFGGEPLFTCVAVVEPQGQRLGCTYQLGGDEEAPPPEMDAERLRRQEEEDEGERRQQRPERIVACVVGTFVHWTRLGDRIREKLVSDVERGPRCFYIMTLGVSSDCRRSGLGSRMIRRCIREVEADPTCGTMYLHVITFNDAAIRFYENLGFSRVDTIEDYYRIDGRSHDCYLYARYFHGAFM